jgi:hypothetical protein
MNVLQFLLDKWKYGSTDDLAVAGLLVVCALWLISNAPKR